ncbi:MAG: hypothetical protein HY870_06165, partial [Chloroflexi bacterium]|nr:hypothetical protein [Chloroflexota bacterium]
MNKSIKRGLLLGLASGFLAIMFGGWAITVLAVFGGILIGFTSRSGSGKPAAYSPQAVAITALIFSALTGIGGIIFDQGLADIAVVTGHRPE